MELDINIVKENYASLLDEQLIVLAEQEGPELREEALKALKEEFVKRKMNTDIFENITHRKIENELGIINEKKIDAMDPKTWEFVFAGKKSGKSDEMIAAELESKGLTSEQINNIITNIKPSAGLYLKKYTEQRTYNFLVFILGIAITAITYLLAASGGTYIIAWGAIIFGLIRFFRAEMSIRTCNDILQSSENDLSPE